MFIKLFIFSTILIIVGCSDTTGKKSIPEKVTQNTFEVKNKYDYDMKNPVMLTSKGGVDIGRLFNAYYRTGQLDMMYNLLDHETKSSFSKEKLIQSLSNLDYGFEMHLSGSKDFGSHFLLTYLCNISQTKVVKQLKVIVENDTARIMPNNILAGQIFLN